MVKEDPLNWEIEPENNFLDIHLLYHPVHEDYWKNFGDIDEIEGNFIEVPKKKKDPDYDGFSMDWSKYITPEESLNLRDETKIDKYGVIEMQVGSFRKCNINNEFSLSIQHDPVLSQPKLNRSHSIVKGITKPSKLKIRTELAKIMSWIIKPQKK